jgi:hypothetical protein
MRTVPRPRRYVSRHLLFVLAPITRYSAARDAYVLRGVGGRVGPVLRAERRPRRPRPFDGIERRRANAVEHRGASAASLARR